jgi:hypothetical protein
MLVEQMSDLLAVVVLFALRLVVPYLATWLFGQVLRRLVPTPS